MEFSKFGKKMAGDTGIGRLMDDLGKAMAGAEDLLMLGGGNPAHIPAVQAKFRERMEQILAQDGKFEAMIGNYDTPQGNREFIHGLADLLRRQFNWDIGPENIALTLGSQSAFFMLFNMFAGEYEGGRHKKILLPLAPEYIGYSDQGIGGNVFVAGKPEIEHIDDVIFKYRVDFDAIPVTEDIGAICVSRPTNPTGNVLTNGEIDKLCAMAKDNGIPLMIDNAYGAPFPNIIFTDVKPIFNEHTILCMSLSKLGLPAARTGIIIASAEIIKAIADMNGIISLAPSGLGGILAAEMVRTGEIITMSQEVVRPYYQQKAERAVEFLREEMKGTPFHIHKPEGALFLWLWFPGLPITSQELYERLRQRRALVVAGHHFFPGIEDQDWRHRHECIRVTYSQDEKTVTAGLKIIADVVKEAHREAGATV